MADFANLAEEDSSEDCRYSEDSAVWKAHHMIWYVVRRHPCAFLVGVAAFSMTSMFPQHDHRPHHYSGDQFEEHDALTQGFFIVLRIALGLAMLSAPGILASVASFCFELGCDFFHNDGDEILRRLIPSPRRMFCSHLRYCQDSISARFSNGASVYSRDQSELPFATHTIAACFHHHRLFALNSRTLFNAKHMGIESIIVYIVDKPLDWSTRFTARKPYTAIRVRGERIHQFEHVVRNWALDIYSDSMTAIGRGLDSEMEAMVQEQAVVIPADAFPTHEARPIGDVVLEVSNFINTRAGAEENITSIVLARCPNLQVQAYAGDRSYARLRVALEDEAATRNVIKAIAKEQGKKISIREVRGTRRFNSPRD